MANKRTEINNKKEFENLFWEICHSNGDNPASLFSDFLEIIICTFSHMQMEERYLQIIKRYPKKAHQMQSLFVLCLKCYSEETRVAGWSDFLGSFYEEYITTPSKASRTGQFFTPPTICNLMAQINVGEDLVGGGKRVNDPTCGSGRTLLAMNTIAPNNYFFGEDIDPMCAYLTTVNFLLNGVKGQVVCWDAFFPADTYRFGFNCGVTSIGMPIVERLEMENSFSYQVWLSFIRNHEAKTAAEPTPTPTPEKNGNKLNKAISGAKTTAPKPQLTLF